MHFHWLLTVICIKGHTDDVKSTSDHVRELAFLFSRSPKSFNKPSEFLLYKTNRLHFPVLVYCNRSQKTSQRVKNNSHTSRLRLVSYFFVLYTLRRHLWSITVHTHGKMLSISVINQRSKIKFLSSQGHVNILYLSEANWQSIFV